MHHIACRVSIRYFADHKSCYLYENLPVQTKLAILPRRLILLAILLYEELYTLHTDYFASKKQLLSTQQQASQLTKNVSGTFGFGCMKVWLNLTFLERNVYVWHWSYKYLVEPNVLKRLFKYSDTV